MDFLRVWKSPNDELMSFRATRYAGAVIFRIFFDVLTACRRCYAFFFYRVIQHVTVINNHTVELRKKKHLWNSVRRENVFVKINLLISQVIFESNLYFNTTFETKLWSNLPQTFCHIYGFSQLFFFRCAQFEAYFFNFVKFTVARDFLVGPANRQRIVRYRRC